MDDRGQFAIDFLFGIVLFLIAFAFVMQFIPGLFISTSADETSIAFASYRTATILTEDPGWWQNATLNQKATDWEEHVSDVERIGLAADSNTKTKPTYTPNVLSMDKILQFMQLDEETVVTKLGLYDNIDGKHIKYGYNISFVKNKTPLIINNTSIVRGSMNTNSVDEFKIVRLTLVETGTIGTFDAYTLHTGSGSASSNFSMSVNMTQKGKLVIDISNFNTTTTSSTFEDVYVDGTKLNKSTDYEVYLKNNTTEFSAYSGNIERNDTLRLDFKPNQFGSTNQMKITFDNVSFSHGNTIEYANNSEPLYEVAQMIVRVWK